MNFVGNDGESEPREFV